MTRRDFFKTASVLTTAAALPMASTLADSGEKCYKTKLFKSFISSPDPGQFEQFAAAGFEGLEATEWDIDPQKAKENRKRAEDCGLRVQSVMRGWAAFNSDDAAERQASAETVIKAIKTAAAYGADAILLVPCLIKNPGPNPWEFDIKFDGNCRVSQVVDGDNAPYEEYINLQNIATERTFEEVQKLIPVAAYEGVTIALENVWNNLWVKPDFAAAFIRMFDSRWVRAYLDLGNHVKYAPPIEWLEAMGTELITKLHIKDYLLNDETKADPWKGFCGMGNGNVDWVAVRDKIEELGLSSWISYEEGNYTPEQYGVIMDDFVNGRKISVPQ